jgi:predicted ATPase
MLNWLRFDRRAVKMYTDLGYRIVRWPRVSAAERADFLLAHSAEI